MYSICVECRTGQFDAKRLAACHADQAQGAVEAVGIAGDDAFEKAVEWTRLVLVGVFQRLQERSHHGQADRGELFDGEVAGFAVVALDRGEAGLDAGGFEGGGGGRAVHREGLLVGELERGLAFDACAVGGSDQD
jgi:hypothetical protein